MTNYKITAAGQVLIDAHPLTTLNHAFDVLKSTGLANKKVVRNGAVQLYERKFSVKLVKSGVMVRDHSNHALRLQASKMNRSAVRRHIRSIDKADPLFWACWSLYCNEGKWSKSLRFDDFAVHFGEQEG